MTDERQLGEVWKDMDFRAKKPWFVKTFSGVSRYHRKKDAVAVGQLFIRTAEEQREKDRTVSYVDFHAELFPERSSTTSEDASSEE
jgi:hypothetical protein